jgi:hypothetical protein
MDFDTFQEKLTDKGREIGEQVKNFSEKAQIKEKLSDVQKTIAGGVKNLTGNSDANLSGKITGSVKKFADSAKNEYNVLTEEKRLKDLFGKLGETVYERYNSSDDKSIINADDEIKGYIAQIESEKLIIEGLKAEQ